MARELKKCEWWCDDSDCEYDCDTHYASSCGHNFILNEGDTEDNNFNFCPYCGGELLEVKGDGN